MASSSAPSNPNTATSASTGRRRGTSVSSVAQSIVTATERVLGTDLPPGFLAATADAASKSPTIGEIRRGSVGQQDGTGRSRSGSRQSTGLSRGSRDLKDGPAVVNEQPKERQGGLEPFPPLTEEPTRTSERTQEYQDFEKRDEKKEVPEQHSVPSNTAHETQTAHPLIRDRRVYTSGYVPPPKLPWTVSTANALKGFWKWFLTPFGFLVTLYGLSVVAWGGMLFLLLCNASPAMCRFTASNGEYIDDCNHIDSPRRKWIEWDSQILNALFCVTGFGLAPWRFRDLWYILSYRLTSQKRNSISKKMAGLQRLAGHYRGWFRLPGSETLDQMSAEQYVRSIAKEESNSIEQALPSETTSDVRLPLPVTKAPDEPLTGVRAPATKIWKADFFIWCQVGNTGFQIALCYYMWGMNRYDRPSWATGLFVALACIIAAVGGVVSYMEGRKVKRVEGVLPSAAVQEAVGAMNGAGELALQHTRSGHESNHVDTAKKAAADGC